MPQPVKLSDPMVDAARAAAADADRSIAGQIEHWARLGRAAEAVLGHDEIVRVKRSGGSQSRRSGGSTTADLAPQARAKLRYAVSEVSAPAYEPGPTPEAWPAWLESRRAAVEALCRLAGARRLAFFGSVLREDFDRERGSDVDVVVDFRRTAELPTARQYFDFREALAQILGAPVDLVELAGMPDGRLKRVIESTQRDFHVEAP
ncbi:MAG: nucleotidyltransferase domain-containing protein [Steroidobacteraceae bacterium]|jgi:predicted nucleotidyltransferase